jgi:hypothetical protein
MITLPMAKGPMAKGPMAKGPMAWPARDPFEGGKIFTVL